MEKTEILENNQGNHNKFWSYVILNNNSVRLKWGRIGGNEQSQLKSFTSYKLLQRFVEKKISEKIKKGYEFKTQEEHQNNQDIYKNLGSRNKIIDLKFCDLKDGKLRYINEYDENKYILIDVEDSWNKNKKYYMISKDDNFGVIIENNKIKGRFQCEQNVIDAIRSILVAYNLYVIKKYKEVYGNVKKVGSRKLCLDSNDNISDGVAKKIISLGSRKLLL